jgi:hypothetical protein
VPKLGERLSTIHRQSDVLGSSSAELNRSAGDGEVGRRITVEDIIADAVAVLATEIGELGVDVSLPRGEHTVSVDPAELQEGSSTCFRTACGGSEASPRANAR